MILQFEDCIDVVRTLWHEFEYVFLFDHACGGHDRQQPDDLTTTGLNKAFGGAQPKMRLTKIEEDDVNNIGINATVLTLKLDDVQSMQFFPPDVSPCWMPPTQQEATRKDCPSRKMKRTQRKVANLKKDLQAKGVLEKRVTRKSCNDSVLWMAYLLKCQCRELLKAGKEKLRKCSKSFSNVDILTHQRCLNILLMEEMMHFEI
jgi:hypothetical protein